MLEQKFNFSVQDLILIYHLKPKNVCVALKLWMVCVFEVVTISAIFKKFRSPEFHQWLVPEHSATAVPPAGPCSDLGRDTGGPAASIGWLWMFVKFETCS